MKNFRVAIPAKKICFIFIGILLVILSQLLSTHSIFAASDGAGNTFDTARDIGQLDNTPETRFFSDSVAPNDLNDYYRFELQSMSHLTVNLTQLSQNVDIFLGDAEGVPITQSRQQGRVSERMEVSLEPGSYYILVRAVLGSSSLYRLSLGAEFIPEDIIVSNPQQPMRDPEIDPIDNQIAWEDDEANLWVTSIDPQTGNFLLDNKELVDTGLAPYFQGRTGVSNGPEWAYRLGGSQIVYTKLEGNSWFLGRAQRTNGTWEAEVLPSSKNGHIPFGSKVPDDENPAIKYSLGSPTRGQNLAIAWRELDDASQGKILSEGAGTAGGRWVEGEKSLVFSRPVNGILQVFKYDIESDTLNQLTFGGADKEFPYMWVAPEFDHELVFLTLENTSQSPLVQQVKIYQNIGGKWVAIKILTPPTSQNFAFRAEPFVYQNHSYISMLALSGFPGLPNAYDDSEVWISGVDPSFDFYRKVNGIENATIRDPEPFVAESEVFVYYTEDANGQSVVHRTTTGLTHLAS